MDDTSAVFDIRDRVFHGEQGFARETERDKFDERAIYALAFDKDDRPAATGRLYIDDNDRFVIGRVCVCKEARGQYLGDLVMRMLLYRALEMGAPAVHVLSQLPAVSFYARYGLAPSGEVVLDEGVPHRWMQAPADQIDIEGSCHKSACANCRENCAECARKD